MDELDVVPGGAHGDGELLAVEADLEGLLAGEPVRPGGHLAGGVEAVHPGAHGHPRAHRRTHSPEAPPDFASTRTPVISAARSSALIMS